MEHLQSLNATTIIAVLTLFVQLSTALATIALAYLVLQWTRKTEKFEITRQTQSDWRDYNLAVMGDSDLQQLEATNHVNEDLSSADVKKMCIYFIKINVPYNLWLASQGGIMDETLMKSEIDVQARLLYSDRVFVELNVFPRGYPPEFCEIFRKLWSDISLRSEAN